MKIKQHLVANRDQSLSNNCRASTPNAWVIR
jgi:hypothetical protein